MKETHLPDICLYNVLLFKDVGRFLRFLNAIYCQNKNTALLINCYNCIRSKTYIKLTKKLFD